MTREEILHLLEDVLDNTQDNERALSYAIELLRDEKTQPPINPLRQPQDSTSGVNAVIGQYPGDETDAQVESVLDTLGGSAKSEPDADLVKELADAMCAELVENHVARYPPIPEHVEEIRQLTNERDHYREQRDHYREQFETLRADMAWTPSEQALEIRRLTNALNAAGRTLSELRQTKDASIAELVASLAAVVSIVESERDYWLGNAYPEDYEAVRVAREVLMKAGVSSPVTEQHTTISVKTSIAAAMQDYTEQQETEHETNGYG